MAKRDTAFFSKYRKLSVVIILLAFLPSLQFGAGFQGLGDLSGGDFRSKTGGISSNGSVVVGSGNSASGSEAFRWTQTGGMIGLGDLGGGVFDSDARGVALGGSVVVGRSVSGPGLEAFRWTQTAGITGLGDLAGGPFHSEAFAVSSDGSVVVGTSASNSPGPFEAFRWTQAGGKFSGSGSSNDSVAVGLSVAISGAEAFRWTQAGGLTGLGDLAGGVNFSLATGVSSGGSVVVGRSESASGMEAFRWTQSGGMIGLGDLDGGSFNSDANGVSSDGSVVVGRSESASGIVAFRWTQTGGMTGLGDLAGGGYFSEAFAVSSNGNVIVGWSTPVSGTDDLEAFIWDALNGMRNLKTVLENDLGLDLTGWTLIKANSISNDGLKIAGWGTNPSGQTEAWLADLTTNKTDQTITFSPIGDRNVEDSPFLIQAEATSGLPVSFSVIEGATIAVVVGSNVTLSGEGQITILANQAGNENFNPAPGVEQTFLVTFAQSGCQGVFCGEEIPGFPGWLASSWYLNYNVEFLPWIFHDEHGWQFIFEDSPEVFFLWDFGLDEWLFVDENSYRWVYLFSDNPGWIWTFEDNDPDRRFFQRADDGSLFSVPPDLPVE